MKHIPNIRVLLDSRQHITVNRPTTRRTLEGMLLHVLNAHTGQRFTAYSEHLTSSDTLKTWLVQASGIAAAHQILLTDAGKQVKLQSILDGVRYIVNYGNHHANMLITG